MSAAVMTTMHSPPSTPATSWRKRATRDEEDPRQESAHRQGKLETGQKRMKVKREEMLNLATELFFQQMQNKNMQETHFHELERKTEGFYFDEEKKVAYLFFDPDGLSELKDLCLKTYHDRDPVCALVDAGSRYHEQLRLEREKDEKTIRKLDTVDELVTCLQGENVKFPIVKYDSSFPSGQVVLRDIYLKEEEDIVQQALEWLD